MINSKKFFGYKKFLVTFLVYNYMFPKNISFSESGTISKKTAPTVGAVGVSDEIS